MLPLEVNKVVQKIIYSSLSYSQALMASGLERLDQRLPVPCMLSDKLKALHTVFTSC